MLQLEKKPIFGYRLYDFGNYWKLVSSKDSFVGNLDEVIDYAVTIHGIEEEEIVYGLQQMQAYFHQAAEYGYFKKFMFTFDPMIDNKKNLQ